MNKLDLIWVLEGHNRILSELEKELKNCHVMLGLDKLKAKTKSLEEEYLSLQEKIKANELQTKKHESTLNQYDYRIKEIDKDLYGGKISDLQQLEYLEEEKAKNLKMADGIESNIIAMLEAGEAMDKSIAIIGRELDNSNDELKKMEKRYEVEKEKFNHKIKEEELAISKIESKLDKEFLNKYNKLRRDKIKAIVPIEELICTGCNMRIPTYLLHHIRSKTEVIYCDNCGRILYYVED